MTQNFQNKIDSFSNSSNKKLEAIDIFRYQNENYLLHQQLEDLKVKYINLKKQQQIWEQINTHNNFSNLQKNSNCCQNQRLELTKMKEQFVIIVKQKQQLEHIIKQQKQKIQYLKYHNSQLRQLHQKQQRIHQKQIQLFQKQTKTINTSVSSFNNHSFTVKKSITQFPKTQNYDDSFDQTINYYDKQLENGYFPINYANSSNSTNKLSVLVKQLERKISEKELKIQVLEQELRKQKQLNTKNQQKLQKCGQISKQMEQYYTNELQQKQQALLSKQQIIKQLQFQLLELQKNSNNNHFIFQSPLRSNLQQNGYNSSLKCSSVISEYQNNQNLNHMYLNQSVTAFQVEQRYEKLLKQLKYNYQKELSKYQDKIKYLLLKVESLEAQKKYLQNQSSDSLGIQSLLRKDHSNELKTSNVQSKNILLKMSKVSSTLGDSFSCTNQNQKSNFTVVTPKQNISRIVLDKQQQKSSKKLASISKTPNNKSLQKYNGNVRNSCHYQRAPLNQSRGNNFEY